MKEEVEKVADNARLNLNEEETEKMAENFKEILEMFETLDNIDTENVEPSFHPVDTESKTREDKVKESLDKEEVFQNTENKTEEFFKGPSA